MDNRIKGKKEEQEEETCASWLRVVAVFNIF